MVKLLIPILLFLSSCAPIHPAYDESAIIMRTDVAGVVQASTRAPEFRVRATLLQGKYYLWDEDSLTDAVIHARDRMRGLRRTEHTQCLEYAKVMCAEIARQGYGAYAFGIAILGRNNEHHAICFAILRDRSVVYIEPQPGETRAEDWLVYHVIM